MSVKVGVRVRPFNQRESDLNCKLCVDMIGNMTRLYDADDVEKHRDFTFDYSFWSHDEFDTNEKGYFVPQGDKYADQQHVFEQVGLQILQNAWDGYHCCLFAYGQTGAGKSYSMVGYGANKGIVPISCEEIFTRIANNPDKNKEYEVQVSMMEIYNEKVQDLLIPISKRPKQGHKIREHKTLGIYVDGMSKHFVDTYDSIEKKMEEGGRNRSIAATEMNASSSRAHTIISIEFKQIEVADNGKKREKLSVIHLVDLAGSEKVGKTGATGDRLKEAAGINKSLSVLGLVISTLADKATGKGKNVVVPYRDSCLTRILQNALGGNSKTLMICAISPANDNYEETLSTLRYADQAKKIQNKAVVNESETDKLIRTLTQQKEELREKVQKMEQMFKKLSQGITPEMLEQLKDAKDELRYNTQKMNDYETTRTQKKKIEQQEENTYASKSIDKTKPHLSNLNEDPQLSRKINYSLSSESSKIGRRGITPANDIEIGGMGIRKLHATITGSEDSYFIEPHFEGEDSGCYLNGDLIGEKVQIMNLDRLSFGTNNMFLVLLPSTPPREEVEETKLDWDFAQNELYLKKEIIEKEQTEEKERKLKQETEGVLKQKQLQLAELMRSLKESEQLRKLTEQQKQLDKIEIEKRIRDEQAMILQKEKEIQSKKKTILDSQAQKKEKTKEKYYFERKLLKTLPKCIELNLIAKQFKKNVSMSVKMMLSQDEEEEQDLQMKKRSIMIKVVNREVGYTYWWDVDTLSNRYYIIKDMSEQYFETGVIPIMDQNNDPFWDPPQPTLIGRSFLTTKALAYMFDNPATLPIIGEDQHCGELVVNLVPTDQTGQRNLCAEMDEEEVQFQPEELLEKPFYFNIQIENAKIPVNYKNIYVQYSFKINEYQKNTFKTEEIKQKTNVPQFKYKKLHSFAQVTENLLKYLTTAKLIFKVYGCEVMQEEKKNAKKEVKTIVHKQVIDPDVEKAKKQDQKKQEVQTSTKTKVSAQIKANKPQESKTLEVTKKETVQPKKDANVTTNKTAGAKVNNKINERDQKNAKEKDCEIY